MTQNAATCTTGQDGKTEKFVSAGQRIHNELTYRGIDFLLNSAIGVAFTYWTARTESGQAWFGRPVSGFFKQVLKPILTSPASLEEGAKWGSMFTSIIVGGTAIIPPMTYMEKKENKKAMIRWLDEKIYGEQKVNGDPRFAACYEALDEESKKNFTTGMAARFIVLAPMIAMTTIPEANAVAVKYLYKPISKATKWAAENAGIRPESLVKRGRIEIPEGDLKQAKRFVSDWDFIHETAGFDFGLTFIYSFAHEATYKTLANMGIFNKREQAETPDTRVANLQLHGREADALAPRSHREHAARPCETELRTSL